MPSWPTVSLTSVADIRVSNVDKKSKPGEKSVRLCNYMDVYSNDYITADLPFMESTASASEVAKFGVCRGDVFITKDSETPYDIGIPSVADEDVDGLVCGYHLALIRPRDEGAIDSAYLAKQLASAEVGAYYARMAGGSTRYGLSTRAIEQTPIKLPPIGTQRVVARVLRKADQAIEKTEALIEKYQQIKAGLMHDLFTRGIGADGKLRPPRDQAPELYQETPIGWIPKDWGIGLLNDIVNPARPIVYGILMPGYGHPGGVPVVKVKDIGNRQINIDGLLLTSPKIDNEYRRSRLRLGDILFTIRGTVGRVCLVPEELENANITQDTARIDIHRGDAPFYSYYFETDRAIRHFSINTLGVAVQGINLGELRKTPIPMPPEHEQVAIRQKLEVAEAKVQAEGASLKKLRAEKMGLMADLLGGNVDLAHV